MLNSGDNKLQFLTCNTMIDETSCHEQLFQRGYVCFAHSLDLDRISMKYCILVIAIFAETELVEKRMHSSAGGEGDAQYRSMIDRKDHWPSPT